MPKAKEMILTDALKYLEKNDIRQQNGKPFTLIGLKKACERGNLKHTMKKAPVPYRVVSETDLLNWVNDTVEHKRGRPTK